MRIPKCIPIFKSIPQKRITTILCTATMIISLTACSGNKTDYSNQTITGQVTSIDGTKVTLQLGELDMQRMGGKSKDTNESDNAPSKNTEEMSSDGNAPNDEQVLPDKPEGDNESNDRQTPPDIPEGDNGSNNGQAPLDNMAAPGFTAGDETITLNLDGAVIQTESAGESTEGSLTDITVDSILSVVFGDNNTLKTVTIKSFHNKKEQGHFGGSGEVSQGTSANTIDSDGTYTDTTYSSTEDDENALRIDNATVTLTDITVEKSEGNSSNTENGDFYGMNAALLAINGANVTISDSQIDSSVQNGNGVFSNLF